MTREKPRKKDFWKLTRRRQLAWERFKEGIQWNFFIYLFMMLVLTILLIFSIVDVVGSMEDEVDFLTYLIPLILLFQLVIFYVQTLNQYRANKIAKIGFLPHINIYSKKNLLLGISKDEEIVISIKNSNTDAHNVGYAVYLDETIVESDVPFFPLGKDKEKEIYYISEKNFKKKQIDVVVKFEDMVKSPPYIAFFRKDANEDSFKTLSTGLY